MSAGYILFIDAYDSFSNNIVSLLREQLKVQIQTVHIDDPRFILNDDAFYDYLKHFDAVVAGPGPGHPANVQDVGLIAKLWQLPQVHLLPVLGICLGFQSLCLSSGTEVIRLREPRHGIVTPISHREEGIFAEVGELLATQYHSLRVQIGHNNEQDWQRPKSCEGIIPLAWDLSDAENGPILMAVEHVSKPFHGVQFHPESVCTDDEGKHLIRNWWQTVVTFSKSKGRKTRQQLANGYHKPQTAFPPMSTSASVVEYKQCSLPVSFELVQFVSDLRPTAGVYEPILLQSGLINGAPVNTETGRYSIIGFHDNLSMHIRYSSQNHTLTVGSMGDEETNNVEGIEDVYTVLHAHIKSRQVVTGPCTPFWGGFAGFISYEAGLEGIDVTPNRPPPGSADVWFVMVERSVVIDHINQCAFVQSIRKADDVWLTQTIESLSSARSRGMLCDKIARPSVSILSSPEREKYCEKVTACQEHLRAGLSYELCLTEQTRLQADVEPWSLYQRLSQLNPVPFGTYFRLQHASTGVAIVGSSPERFLSWSRGGRCQFRPIKGTVPKSAGATRAEAELILRSQKEQAENLMIVDLIRHDLSGVPGVSNVEVSSLMAVEEYATVFQLVSVIEGDMSAEQSGIDVLAASLPPGSMTGAPKKRSCELLKSIEQEEPRSIYSGITGYLDIGGGGDFSVVIRTAFKWDSEDFWRVGAGGAVTVLSSPDGEYEEMLTKRERLMTAFS